jgi:flagella synthesis protein FlgN
MQATGKNPASTLNDEIAATKSLVDVLKREQTVLIAADTDALPALNDEKAQLIARIAGLTHTRYQALSAAGFPDEEAGMKAWVESPSASAGANKSWSDLLDAARAAKELNRVNGMLIGKHLARNQAALNVLQGNRQASSLYGPNGQTAVTTGSRGLVVG